LRKNHLCGKKKEGGRKVEGGTLNGVGGRAKSPPAAGGEDRRQSGNEFWE